VIHPLDVNRGHQPHGPVKTPENEFQEIAHLRGAADAVSAIFGVGSQGPDNSQKLELISKDNPSLPRSPVVTSTVAGVSRQNLGCKAAGLWADKSKDAQHPRITYPVRTRTHSTPSRDQWRRVHDRPGNSL
jgi:hypothetical protein